MSTTPSGVRSATLVRSTSNRLTFGAERVPATVEHVRLPTIGHAADVSAMVLRCTTVLPAGRYALLCGANAYELEVEAESSRVDSK